MRAPSQLTVRMLGYPRPTRHRVQGAGSSLRGPELLADLKGEACIRTALLECIACTPTLSRKNGQRAVYLFAIVREDPVCGAARGTGWAAARRAGSSITIRRSLDFGAIKSGSTAELIGGG
jgi:hypothetical protein